VINSFVKELFSVLNDNYNYAVLRGYEELPEKFAGHDIDIIVDKKQFSNIKRSLSSLINDYNFKIIMINESDRFVTIVIAVRIESKIEYLYLDFFFNFSLFGIVFRSGLDVLKEKKFNGRVYHVSVVDEFLEKYLNTCLLGESYPEKYSHVFDSAQDEHIDKLTITLSSVFNSRFSKVKDISTVSRKKLLFTALVSSLRRAPIEQFNSSLCFLYLYIRCWLKPNGFSFSLTGPDGSGKTTVLNSVEGSLANIFREVNLFHFRPSVIPRIAEVLKNIGLKREVDVDYSKPHRGGEVGKISSFVRLSYYVFDYIVGYFLVVRPALFKRHVVIFDRYFTDVMSDSLRSRIGINYKIIFLFRKIVPKMNYNFFIFVEPQEILNRKQELTREQINVIYDKLNYICNNDPSYVIIDNNSSPENAVNDIIDYIFDHQHKKYERKL